MANVKFRFILLYYRRIKTFFKPYNKNTRF